MTYLTRFYHSIILYPLIVTPGWILAQALHQSNNQSDAGLMARVVVLEGKLKNQETEINKVMSQSWAIRKHAKENIDTIKKELELAVMRCREEHIHSKQEGLKDMCLHDGDSSTSSPPHRRVASFEVLGSP